MAVERVVEGVHVVRGVVNVYLVESGDGLVLLDTGFPRGVPKILRGLSRIGRAAGDVRHIVLTHAHPDHIGGAAELKRLTGATVWANPINAPIMRAGTGFRPVHATPGLVNLLISKVAIGWIRTVQPVEVDALLGDGDRPPFLPDLLTIHAPGHCAGQNAFLLQRAGGVLFPADACVNTGGPGLPAVCEDLEETRRSLSRLAHLSFDTVCFMHGAPIRTGGREALRRIASS